MEWDRRSPSISVSELPMGAALPYSYEPDPLE